MKVPLIKRLDRSLIDSVAEKARNNQRLRQNYNFHELPEKVQRFMNVLQPGTYVRPHRHLRDPAVNGFEMFVVLRGTLGILIVNEAGEILLRERVDATGPTQGVELTEGTYHTLVALAPDTAVLELKEGPYNPATDKHFLEQFPQEGTPEAQACVAAWEQEFAETRELSADSP